MTREEAIEIFKNMLDAWDNYYTIAQSDKKREAVWLAISSLETDEAYQLEYERTTKNDSSELEKNSKKLEKDFDELVEIDLYSVIKQKYIEREVFDKIRAEIETKYGQCDICEYFDDYDYEENDISEYRPIGNIADILQIIDKYKAETE